MPSSIKVVLNDRELMRIAIVKNYLGYDTQQALGLIIAACDRKAIQRAMLMLKPPAPKPAGDPDDDYELINLTGSVKRGVRGRQPYDGAGDGARREGEQES